MNVLAEVFPTPPPRREWFSAVELASMRLPGVPHSARGISYRAKARRWRCRPRKGRGGGIEFHVAALPYDARLELLMRQAGARLRKQRDVPARSGRDELIEITRGAIDLLADLMRELRRS